MKKLQRGMFARSIAGRDKGRLYLVLAENEKYVILSDGRLRPLDRPKKKKRMHVQPDYHFAQGWSEATALTDAAVKDAIRRKEERNTCQSQTSLK